MCMLEYDKHWGTMACAECEDLVLELQHGQLAESARRAVEAHLAGCPTCRDFADSLKLLDDALTMRFGSKTLPAGFKATVLFEIDASSQDMAPEAIARRREAFESEFRAQSVGLLKRILREHWGSFLDAVGVMALALGLGLVLQRISVLDLGFSAVVPKALEGHPEMGILSVTAAICIAGAVWLGVRKEPRRFFG